MKVLFKAHTLLAPGRVAACSGGDSLIFGCKSDCESGRREHLWGRLVIWPTGIGAVAVGELCRGVVHGHDRCRRRAEGRGECKSLFGGKNGPRFNQVGSLTSSAYISDLLDQQPPNWDVLCGHRSGRMPVCPIVHKSARFAACRSRYCSHCCSDLLILPLPLTPPHRLFVHFPYRRMRHPARSLFRTRRQITLPCQHSIAGSTL